MHKPAARATAADARRASQQDPVWVRWTLTIAALLVVGLLIAVPVVNVFYYAFADGLSAYWRHLAHDPHTRHSIWLTLTVAAAAVTLNVIFGVAAAWAVTRFRFRGRTLLVSFIDLPFAISPVVAGLMLVLIFGLQGYLGKWLILEQGIRILFAWPGIVIATTFITLPFVARELIPVMEAIGSDEEMAAVSLGANARQLFWRVTLPNIKWGLLYGIILCNARAMGEFGAVAVVAGKVGGKTQTMPLRVTILFEDGALTASFALASLLTMLALVTLVIKVILERKTRRDLEDAARIDVTGGHA